MHSLLYIFMQLTTTLTSHCWGISGRGIWGGAGKLLATSCFWTCSFISKPVEGQQTSLSTLVDANGVFFPHVAPMSDCHTVKSGMQFWSQPTSQVQLLTPDWKNAGNSGIYSSRTNTYLLYMIMTYMLFGSTNTRHWKKITGNRSELPIHLKLKDLNNIQTRCQVPAR